MLDEAVKFTNRTHGDNAVFRARLDRDEEGRHGVDVFFAPKYQKKTTRRSSEWVSLTKFGKELAVQKFGQKQRQKKNKAGEFEPVFDKAGKPVMEDCDHQHYQGRALQDAFFEHLRDEMGLDWVVRGEKKIGRDSDRLEVEEYKIQAETEKLSFRAEVALEREQGLREKEAELTGREKKVKDGRFDRLLRRDPSAAEQVSAAQDAQREAENRIETVKAAAARDVAAAERRAAERFSERLRNVEQREREVKAQEDLLFAALLAVPPCSPGEEEKIGWIASDIDNTWVADVLDEHNAPEFIFDKELKLSTAMSLLKGWLRLQAQKIDQIFTEIIKRTTSVPRPASRPTAEPRRENPKQPHRAPEKKPDPKSNTPKQRFDPWTDGPPGP
ncbi:MAG: hypothetical protein OIF40_06485 [Mangrovicoccus sp.]|nr:hypothetical protein [Mangrovicoccus sp.]